EYRLGHVVCAGRPWRHGMDGHACTGQYFGHSSGQALQRGRADAVMHHLGGDVQCRLTGDELDTAPTLVAHALGVVASQAHAAHDVDLEVLLPQLVIDIEELPGAIDAEVVDQDVGLRLGGDQRLSARLGTGIRHHATGIIAP